MNYPLECWDVNVISHTVAPYGRFLIWNKDPRDKTRIIVKVRVINPDTLPLSIVVLHNLDDIGYGDSWTCPTYIMSREIIGQQGGDEDPLPPDGGNPHPLPHVGGGFWHDEVLGNIPMEQVVVNPHNENLGAPYEDVHAAEGYFNVAEIQEQFQVAINENLPDNAPAAVNEAPHNAAKYAPALVIKDLNLIVSADIEVQVDAAPVEVVQNIPSIEEDFIPVPMADSHVFSPQNASMNYNDNAAASEESQTHNSITVEGNTEHISALQQLIGNLAAYNDKIIPKIGEANIVNAACQIVDIEGSNGARQKCILQFQT